MSVRGGAWRRAPRTQAYTNYVARLTYHITPPSYHLQDRGYRLTVGMMPMFWAICLPVTDGRRDEWLKHYDTLHITQVTVHNTTTLHSVPIAVWVSSPVTVEVEVERVCLGVSLPRLTVHRSLP